MEITFDELREKEVINIASGKKLGRIIDLILDLNSAKLRGLVVPGEKKIFKKSEDLFISIKQIQKIGDDVILVSVNDIEFNQNNNLSSAHNFINVKHIKKNQLEGKIKDKKGNFARFRRISNNKYK